MITMQLLKTISPENCLVKKTVQYGEDITINMKDSYDYIRPVVTIKADMYPYATAAVNYCRIWNGADLYLYYFIRDAVQSGGTNKLVNLHLELDVLTTYKDFIKQNIINGNCIISRSGAINSAEGQPMEDENVTIGARNSKNVTITEFASPLTWDNPYFVLAVVGSYGVFHSTPTA